MRKPRAVAALAAAGLLTWGVLAGPQTKPPAKAASFQVLTKGLLTNAGATFRFPSEKLELEIRDLVMGNGTARDIPTPTRMLLEVRGGLVKVTINGKTENHVPGDMFGVDQGAKLELENPGDVTVIRAIYIHERQAATGKEKKP